jgi:hypothetical protein
VHALKPRPAVCHLGVSAIGRLSQRAGVATAFLYDLRKQSFVSHEFLDGVSFFLSG